MVVLGSVAFVPGAYAAYNLWHAVRGTPGFHLSDIAFHDDFRWQVTMEKEIGIAVNYIGMLDWTDDLDCPDTGNEGAIPNHVPLGRFRWYF